MAQDLGNTQAETTSLPALAGSKSRPRQGHGRRGLRRQHRLSRRSDHDRQDLQRKRPAQRQLVALTEGLPTASNALTWTVSANGSMVVTYGYDDRRAKYKTAPSGEMYEDLQRQAQLLAALLSRSKIQRWPLVRVEVTSAKGQE